MRLKLERSGPWIGITGLAVMLWIIFASLFFAPWWGIGLFLVGWIIAAVVVARLARTKPNQCTYVPFGLFAVWLAIALAGGAWWGWGN